VRRIVATQSRDSIYGLPSISPLGDKAYAAEELIAELCSAFLCAEFALDGELRHAGYIQSWIGLLKTDCRAFFTACSNAQAAADYLRGLALRDQRPTVAA